MHHYNPCAFLLGKDFTYTYECIPRAQMHSLSSITQYRNTIVIQVAMEKYKIIAYANVTQTEYGT